VANGSVLRFHDYWEGEYWANAGTMLAMM
jgi:hypothetical protein